MGEEIALLKNFRRRFILIAMVLVGVVAFVAFAAIDIANYHAMRQEIAVMLDRATQPSKAYRQSIVPQDSQDGQDSSESSAAETGDDDDGGRAMAMHPIPVCTVSVSYSDRASFTSLSDGIGLDDETLTGALAEALQSTSQNAGQGLQVLSDYGLYYKVNSTQTGFKVAFVPKSVLWNDLGQRTLVLAGAWALLMLAMFCIAFFLSRYVTRPVERAWKDQQRFIADASHELKTPLTVIMADVSILKEAPEKTVREQSSWVEGISNEAERMKQLTEDLLTLAQADAGVDTRQIMGDVDFSSVVEGQVLQFDAVAFERGLVIDDEVTESLHLLGDEMRLENMVKTLLENACKYSRQPGTIDVSLKRERNDAVLKIHNPGDPIPPEDLPHLFDRFYRSDKARVHEGESASFGLGLSIAKSTAELHGGTIAVASDEGGTTFTVKLPLGK